MGAVQPLQRLLPRRCSAEAQLRAACRAAQRLKGRNGGPLQPPAAQQVERRRQRSQAKAPASTWVFGGHTKSQALLLPVLAGGPTRYPVGARETGKQRHPRPVSSPGREQGEKPHCTKVAGGHWLPQGDTKGPGG